MQAHGTRTRTRTPKNLLFAREINTSSGRRVILASDEHLGLGESQLDARKERYEFSVIAQTGDRYPIDRPGHPVPAAAMLGDCWHRYYVRMLEVVESMRLVRQAIEKYSRASGGIGEPIRLTQKLPKGEAYLETEAPKGQMGFMVISDGAAIPWRVRARSSSFCNLSVMHELCRGGLIADVPAVLGSLDIVLGEIDR